MGPRIPTPVSDVIMLWLPILRWSWYALQLVDMDAGWLALEMVSNADHACAYTWLVWRRCGIGCPAVSCRLYSGESSQQSPTGCRALAISLSSTIAHAHLVTRGIISHPRAVGELVLALSRGFSQAWASFFVAS